MNNKEVGEIRRRFRRDRSNIRSIYGCYVRDDKEIISEFRASLGTLPENEAEKYMALFKKTLGGKLGKTLHNISFSTKQVADKEDRYNALAELRSLELSDKERRRDFYKRVIDSLQLEHNYLILLSCETYDVPFKTKDDATMNDAADQSFTYILCSICPVKDTKPNLHYVHSESTFHDGGMIQAVSSPIMGFMFPAFDDRSTNLYGALYFSKDTSDTHTGFTEEIFGHRPLRPADAEKNAFDAMLASTLGDECNIDTIQSIHQQASARVQLHKEAKVPEPLTMDRSNIQSFFIASGISAEKSSKAADAFTEAFGFDAHVPLENIIETRRYTVTTPDVVIKIAPERAQNIEVRTIGGQKYIMVLAEGDIQVNGVQLAESDND